MRSGSLCYPTQILFGEIKLIADLRMMPILLKDG